MLTIEDYLENISVKQLELFALSFVYPELRGKWGFSTFSQSGKTIGQSIGLAFQIMDDILDYSQSESALGKPVLEDVKQGAYSLLPLLLASEKERAVLPPLLEKKPEMTGSRKCSKSTKSFIRQP